MRYLKAVVRLLIVTAILVSTFLAAKHFLNSSPEPRRRPPQGGPPLVEILEALPGDEIVTVSAMGTVMPAQNVTLQTQVGGIIIEQSPNLIPGGFVKEGEVILRIDPEDYRLAVEQRRVEYERALYEYSLEEGRQRVAKREWGLLGNQLSTDSSNDDLALRRPHLRYAQAVLAAASSAFRRAELDLERTVVRAPFDALVQDEFVDVGQLVTSQTRLATLVATDQVRVQVSIPVDRLDWIFLPGINGNQGSRVRVYMGNTNGFQTAWEGRILRLLGDVDPAGRMARVLVTVNDPFGLERSASQVPLMIGSYVRVDIEGRRLDNVFAIPRLALRDDTSVWIADSNNRLEIRNVSIVWRRENEVLVDDGIDPGERIVLTRIPVPVRGMTLRPTLADGQEQAPSLAGSEERTAEARTGNRNADSR